MAGYVIAYIVPNNEGRYMFDTIQSFEVDMFD
jgi:hypothetical protein